MLNGQTGCALVAHRCSAVCHRRTKWHDGQKRPSGCGKRSWVALPNRHHQGYKDIPPMNWPSIGLNHCAIAPAGTCLQSIGKVAARLRYLPHVMVAAKPSEDLRKPASTHITVVANVECMYLVATLLCTLCRANDAEGCLTLVQTVCVVG